MENTFLSEFLFHFQISKRSLYALISLLLLCLLAYNSFFTQVPISPKTPPAFFLAGKSRNSLSSKVEPVSGATHLPHLRKNRKLAVSSAVLYHPKTRKRHTISFQDRVNNFFLKSECKLRFFMTWISLMESFGGRELFAVKSLLRAHHPDGCLVIASTSLDSTGMHQILKPLLNKGFKVAAISPDFTYLFNNTPAESWYKQLMLGKVNPGDIPIGQNLSNLLRLGLLYRFGGVYLDTDVIVLKNLGGLRNAIGAQTIDVETGNWSRLNNAVMIFDEGHPLLYKFIQEFALTFNGNKWGHNGPYLVSRVVSRVSGRPGYNCTVLPPVAFYPVDWAKIGSLFEGPTSLSHSKWLVAKLRQIRSKSFALHLWNKQSRRYKVEKGSIIQHLMFTSTK